MLFRNFLSCRVQVIFLLITLFFHSHVHAAICTTTAPGAWNCGIPTVADDLIVNHDVTITGDWRPTGSITVNSGVTLTFTGTFDPDGSSIVTISGTIDVADNMRLRGSSTVKVTSTGTLNALADFRTGPGTSLTVDAGGIANVGGDFRMELGSTVTSDGTLDVVGEIRLDGSLCGTGIVLYSGNCRADGDACGDTDENSICDGSGIITSGTLPIELLWFKAKQNGILIELYWSTASEINNDFFTIERSKDGLNFHELMTLEGAGTTNLTMNYSAVDTNPFYGFSYYRLKQTDYDGQFAYSDIIVVKLDQGLQALDFTLFPNPTKDKLSVQVKGNTVLDLYIEIYNAQGQKLENITPSVNIDGFELDVEHMNTGLYLVHLINEDYRGIRKFVKK